METHKSEVREKKRELSVFVKRKKERATAEAGKDDRKRRSQLLPASFGSSSADALISAAKCVICTVYIGSTY